MLIKTTERLVTKLGSRVMSTTSSFYDIKEKSARTGDTVEFSTFKGSVCYGVNVASR